MASFFVKQPKPTRVQVDFERLRDRMRRRLYPETVDSLAYYWLKTVFRSGYEHEEWVALDRLLEQHAGDGAWTRISDDLRERIRRAGLLSRDASRSVEPLPEGARGITDPETLLPYIVRLLNEWAPTEVARLLVGDSDRSGSDEDGIPAIAFGRAVERLFARERLSSATLETLLRPGLFSPRYIYPKDAEILRDVVLFLLGRTEAPPADVLPATLLCVAPDAPFSSGYGDTVPSAYLVETGNGEELHVSIPLAQAFEVLRTESVRITSIVVTMDGRWWQAEKLRGGERSAVVYRPMGRLRIDDSEDHVRVRVPWPEARLRWAGQVHFSSTVEIFGREWHVEHWEQDADRTWLDLVFSRTLPVTEVAPDAETILHRARPAAVDMAWTALENALETALATSSREPIEQLRRAELVPLGRALFALSESLIERRLRKKDEIETRLRAIVYHVAELEPAYGLVPWRVLPDVAVRVLLRDRSCRALGDSLRRVFAGVPETASEARRELAGAAR